MNSTLHLTLLAISFVLYAALHSLLAADRFKAAVGRRYPQLLSRYRLLYNLLALLLLLPTAWLLWQWPQGMVWQRPELLRWLGDGLALAALAAFVHSLKSYDLSLFSGTRQWRERGNSADGNERFRVGFWHRFVRHPWYCFALIILWTRDMHAAQLLLYTLVTGYLVVGSRLEERKLVRRFGDAYRRYRERVPGLLPLPGRYLTATEAAALQQSAG